MTLATRLIEHLARLPPAHSRDIEVERRLPARMNDGVVLLADRYIARGSESAPIVLVRTPYNRGAIGGLFARIFAERGYQVVVQSVRGTFDSGGRFDAFRDEERDGRATLEWLSKQPWFSGRVGLFGASYLGLTQWAVAADAPSFVQALAVQISGASFRDLLYPGGSFGLHGALTWISLIHQQRRPLPLLVLMLPLYARRLTRAFGHLPLREADRVATGCRVPYFQDWLVHAAPSDPFWQAIDHSRGLDRVRARVNLVAGWHDIFLGRQLADYVALREAGGQPHLTVGPWEHRSAAGFAMALRESLAWFDTYLRDQPERVRRAPVRIFVVGAGRWLDLDDWPPPALPHEWYLQADRVLASEPPATAAADSYVYDPARPTPAVGGPLLNGAFVYDNRQLEGRPDVLTYTSAPLDRDLTVIGAVDAELFVQSSLACADFFVRLCDVEPDGRSLNVCDGITRLVDATWPACVRVELSETAYCFRRGHRLRLQIASGAFPRFSRNLGTSEPLGEGRSMVGARQTVLHGPAQPSRLRLSTVGTLGADDLL